MRGRIVAALAVLLVLSLLAGSCTPSKLDLEPEIDVSGIVVTVWDLSQPAVQGGPDYRALSQGVISEFESRHDIRVDLRIAGRREVADLLLGKTGAEKPDLVCTGEWPFVPDGIRSLPKSVSPDSYVNCAATYWQRDGALAAIPAYVHWIGMGHRESGDGVAYVWDSPAFLAATIGYHRWDAESVMRHLEWVLSEWGEAPRDPLGRFLDGNSKTFFPLTPSMWRRMREEDRGVSLGPVQPSGGEPSYFYTVPAYVVLAEDPIVSAAATELGVALAANLGRWAARALSCLPALREDVPVWNLMSGLGFEERAAVLQSLSSLGLSAPAAGEYSEWESLDAALRQVTGDYLSKGLDDEEALQGIRETLERHTRP